MATYNPFYPATGYVSATSTAPGHSRLAYFITRNNGLPVPLIPADELPFSVKLQNVPRVLTPDQTLGLQYAGSAPYTGVTFVLDKEVAGLPMQRSTSGPPGESMHARSQSGAARQFLAPDAHARQALASHASSSPQTLPMRPVSASETAKSWRRTEPLPSSSADRDATQSAIDAILHSSSGAETADRIGYRSRSNITPPPSGVIPDQEKKIYCTHWILQGWCMYEQQGCRYKHEMLDEEGLKSIGIKHTPRWWKEQNAPVKLGFASSAEKRAAAAGTSPPTTVGVLTKPEDWLKARKGSESSIGSSEDGQHSETTAATSEEETLTRKGGKQAVTPSTSSKSSKATSPTLPPARPSTPVQKAVKTREPSTTSDLIDFAPLLPTLSSSRSTSKSTAGYVEILKRAVKVDSKEENPGKSPIARKPAVFVPAGESPEVHIADFKKRERLARNKTTRTPSPVQKTKTTATTSPEAKKDKEAVKIKPTGLQASRWAAAAHAQGHIKRTKSDCRPRRPGSSSPAARKSAADKNEKK
ncbi:hypothetical protein DOTSEDRAFT_33250 [Lecanosticta acicola]|uniref:C3H1-type domain-containing protein n=1 Tax=Lecanosticta acicola TaxID=111012 RepID=A0AAI8W0T7_9PEZI|nr:hypothetical protein DOTSEDRAFT_33250 [Lecanosticta acicola]